MFRNRDPNIPMAPAVHVPSLGAGPKASCFTPTVFRAASGTRAEAGGGATAGRRSASPSSSASSPLPQTRELRVIECDLAYEAVSYGEPVEAAVVPAVGSQDYLLSNEDFVEELVREVRQTCQKAQHEQVFLAETEAPCGRPVFVSPNDEVFDTARHLHHQHEQRSFTSGGSPHHHHHPSSPRPREPPRTAQTASLWRSDEASTAGQRPTRVRSRSPPASRSFSPSPDQSRGLDVFSPPLSGSHVRGDVGDGLESASPSTVALAASSRTSSPGPRVPLSGPYSPGGALLSSLRRNRSPGVEREGSPDIVIELDADAKDDDEMASASRHPQWTPHHVAEARPAWNQRRPPPRARPLVSSPGSVPPRAHSRERRPSLASPASGPRVERPGTPRQDRPQPDAASARATPDTRRTVDGKAATPLSIKAEEVVGTVAAVPLDDATAPPSRALFPCRDRPAQDEPAAAAVTLVEAVERASRAEARVEALEVAMKDLTTRHAQAIEAWSTRCVQLTQQVQFVLEWVQHQQQQEHGALGQEMTLAPATPSFPAAAATPSVATKPQHTKGERGDDDDEDDAPMNSPGDADGAGATPTPVRRPGTVSGAHSASQVRVPPSPPLVLQLQSNSLK